MKIAGQDYARGELLARCSNLSAMYGARRISLEDGKASGMKAVEVRTAAGMRCLFSEERCLDLMELDFKGTGLGFLCKNGIVSNAYAEPAANDFWRYWTGGMLATCGLRNTGEGCTVDGEKFPQHGHIGLMPASNVGICVDEENITVTGTMRESAMFGHCLEMKRTISIPVSGAQVRIEDEVRNLTANPEPLFLLYHFNFGFPFLSEALELCFPEGETRARDENAARHMEEHTRIAAPVNNEAEQCYFHLARDTNAEVRLTNRSLGMTARLRYDTGNLPILTQWKSMRAGDYALGIEPGTSLIRGRAEELKNGYDVCLGGYESMTFAVELALESV